MEEKLNKWCNWGGRVLTADPILEAGISKYSVSFWLEHFQTQSPGFENEQQGRKLLVNWNTVFTLRNKNVAYLCWWLILFFVKPCRLVTARMSCQMVEWLQDRMQLQSLNSLCSSNAVWHRFWTENWPKQYTAKGRAQDRKNRSKFVGSGKEGPERASQTFFIAISNILFFSKLASVAKFQHILLLKRKSHSVSRQRIPESGTVFCSQRILFPGNTLPDTEERLATPSGSTSTTF